VNFPNIKTFLIDGDGVLWRADQAIPGLNHFFDGLEQRGIQWALLTNNNTRTAGAYVQKLRGFGVQADESIVFTSSTVTADYLKGRYGHGAPVHVVGMRGLINTLEDAGFKVTHGKTPPAHDVVAVAAGMDRAISYDKILVAMRLILNGAQFIATNTDGSFPAPDGLSPGTGIVIAALRAATGVEPTVMGKPEAHIFQTAMRRFDATPETAAMVGDRLETDILGANRLGIETIAVLTGVTSHEQIRASEIKPDHVFDSIAEFTDALLEAW
jgi:4-nitrophenyl phosphatase